MTWWWIWRTKAGLEELAANEQLVRELARKAQTLIDDLDARAPEDETFDQAGMLDGDTIVREYVAAGEIGLAVDHLAYMVDESAIAFPHDASRSLDALVRKLGTPR